MSSPRLAITPARLLVAILMVAAILRLVPVWFGLPYERARPDEDAALSHAMHILSGDLNPHFFHWPSLTFYVFALLFAAGGPDLSVVTQLLIARTFVAVCGTLTVFVVFRCGTRVAGELTGLLAALFLAVAFLHVRDSHFAMTDILMTLCVTASIALILGAFEAARTAPPIGRPGLRSFAAAGLMGGLATSTKYSAAAVAGSMVVAQILLLIEWNTARLRAVAWTPALAWSAAFTAGFLVATPYALLDYPTFVADLRFDFTHLAGGHSAAGAGPGWIYHLQQSLPYGVGLPIFIAAIPGTLIGARRHPRIALIIAGFVLPFYASIGSGLTVFVRYILPLVPVVCVMAAIGVRETAAWAAKLTSTREYTAIAALAAIVAAPVFAKSAWFDILLAKTDTRVIAGRWLIPQLTPDQSVHQAGGLYVDIYLDQAPVHQWYWDEKAHGFDDEGHTPVWLVFLESPLWTYAAVPPELKQVAHDKYDLVQVVPGTTVAPIKGHASSYYDLDDAFFLPIRNLQIVRRPGPTVSIYRKKPGA